MVPIVQLGTLRLMRGSKWPGSHSRQIGALVSRRGCLQSWARLLSRLLQKGRDVLIPEHQQWGCRGGGGRNLSPTSPPSQR